MGKKRSHTKSKAHEEATPAADKGEYVNDTGEVLMTEAEFRAKAAKEQVAPESAEDFSKMSKEEIVDHVSREETHDFLEFTVSGCYYDSKKETVDYENIKIKIPACDEENGVGSMHVRGRYVTKALKAVLDKNGDQKYPKRVEKMRQVFIDDCVPAKGWLSFVGKNIKELSVDEMQDLATSKDLRFVPLPNSGLSKRDMLIRTYVAYCNKVLGEMKRYKGQTIKHQEEDFNFAKLAPIFLDSSTRTEDSLKITNEEMIEQELTAPPVAYGERDKPEDRFTLQELKTIADSKNVMYAPDAEFKELYNILFTKPA